MKLLYLFCMLFLAFRTAAQEDVYRKVRLPIWTYHDSSTAIQGVSVGLATSPSKVKNNLSNGIKIELLGFGGLLLFAPVLPFAPNDNAYLIKLAEERHEKINGVLIAGTGSLCPCQLNGIAAGGIGQYVVGLNGIGVAQIMWSERANGLVVGAFTASNRFNGFQFGLVSNATIKGNGLMISALNFSERFKGVQMGLFNQSDDFKGIQLGLWNKNNKRSLPIINWNFRN